MNPKCKVEIGEQTLTIKALQIMDVEVAEYFKGVPGDKRCERIQTALKMGVASLRVVEITERVDYVKKEFKNQRNVIQKILDEYLGEKGVVPTKLKEYMGDKGKLKEIIDQYLGENGELPENLKKFLGDNGKFETVFDEFFGKRGKVPADLKKYLGENGELNSVIKEYFGERGKVPLELKEYLGDKGKLQEKIDKYFGEKGEVSTRLKELFGEDGELLKMFKEELDPHKEDSHLYKLRRAIHEDIEGLRSDLKLKEKEEIEEGMTGKPYENKVHQKLESLAEIFDDKIEDVSELDRAGDLEITLNGEETGGREAKISVEVRKRKVSYPKLQQDLKDYKENRGTVVGIAVLPKERVPRRKREKSSCFRRIPQDNNLICAYEENGDSLALEMAYKVARMDARNIVKGKEIEIDEEEILHSVERIDNQLRNIATIKRKITNAQKKLEEVHGEQLDGLRDAIRRELDVIKSALRVS